MEGRREGGRKANITRIFLSLLRICYFYILGLRDCREHLGESCGARKTRCRLVCQNIFVHDS